MPDYKKEIADIMKKVRAGVMPSSEKIVDEAFDELGFLHNEITQAEARLNFNQLLHDVWVRTLSVLERYEDQAYATGIFEHLAIARKDDINQAEIIAKHQGLKAAVAHIFEVWYPYLRAAFLSIAQSRKTRGGRDFELQFGRLLELSNIPYQKIKRQTRVDFMIPSDEAYSHNPNRAVIASLKRTLRERWREVVEELHSMRSPNVYLVTADENISGGHVDHICRVNKLHLVVWDNVKSAKFPNEPLVIGFTDWACHKLEVFQRFWKKQ